MRRGRRVLRVAVHAAVDVPGFDCSAMDGFAVRADDVTGVPTTLRVVADLPAGADLDPPIAAGEAVRIMTGAPVPTHATAVVPFEDTADGLAGGLGPVTVLTVPRGPGAHIRRRGSDVREGSLVVAAGVAGAAGAARPRRAERCTCERAGLLWGPARSLGETLILTLWPQNTVAVAPDGTERWTPGGSVAYAGARNTGTP